MRKLGCDAITPATGNWSLTNNSDLLEITRLSENSEMLIRSAVFLLWWMQGSTHTHPHTHVLRKSFFFSRTFSELKHWYPRWTVHRYRELLMLLFSFKDPMFVESFGSVTERTKIVNHNSLSRSFLPPPAKPVKRDLTVPYAPFCCDGLQCGWVSLGDITLCCDHCHLLCEGSSPWEGPVPGESSIHSICWWQQGLHHLPSFLPTQAPSMAGSHIRLTWRECVMLTCRALE